MKPLLVNTYTGSGAAIACSRLHQGLRKSNIPSRLLILEGEEEQKNEIYRFHPPEIRPGILKRLGRKTTRILIELKLSRPYADKSLSEQKQFLEKRQTGLEMFSFPTSGSDITADSLYEACDIINLHWVAGFLDYPSFFRKNGKPVVWTLHDMNPFSGGEHYEEVHLGVDMDGRPRERMLGEFEKEMSAKNMGIKSASLRETENLHLVSPSAWLAGEASKSEVLGRFPVTVIPNGVDTSVFSPRDKYYSRDLLGLPQDRPVILFVADSLGNQRKGYPYIIKAMESLAEEEVVLCAVGAGGNMQPPKENLFELGRIDNELFMSVVYSAADLFIIPSVMDNLPNAALESLCCGTPIAGFPTGGIPEMVIHGENGLLCPEISAGALQETITLFLRDQDRFNREKISREAHAKYDVRLQAGSYQDLFERILNG